MAQPTFAEIKGEFDETLGYIRGDLDWLIKNKPNLHYSVALLVGCGCEMLAASRDHRKRHGEVVFAELLPPGDWQVLATTLYGALRDGLAHGFDTKHILVDGKEHQICLNSTAPTQFTFRDSGRGLILSIEIKSIAGALCAKITDLENLLKQDAEARERFMKARQRPAKLSQDEATACAFRDRPRGTC
jgi:hypothetical protein